MLIIFFDIRGLVHHEFIPEEREVNKGYYLIVLKCLRRKICQKRLDLWKNNSFIRSGSVCLSLFLKLKMSFQGTRFDSMKAIKQNSWKELKAIPESSYEKCFKDWKKRWNMCVALHGPYFEGDWIDIEK